MGDQDDDVDDANDDVFTQEETDPVLQLQKPSSSAPALDPPSNNPGGHVETMTKNYDEKYAVKYFIKNLVQTRMRLGQRINNVPDPLLSSTPMIKKLSVGVTKDQLKSMVLREGDEMMTKNMRLWRNMFQSIGTNSVISKSRTMRYVMIDDIIINSYLCIFKILL